MIMYFSYHALSGDQSVLKWIAYQQLETEAKLELAELTLRHDQLLTQNQMLRLESLDQDYLDERIRAKLGYVHPDDRIIMLAPITG